MKIFVFLIFFFGATIGASSQDCYAIFRTRDKDIGWETFYGSMWRDGWYVSIAKQFYKKDSIPPNYYILLYNKHKKRVDKFTLVSFRTMRILLEDASMVSLDSARYTNHDKGFQIGVSIKVFLTEDEVKQLDGSQIVRFHFDDDEVFINKSGREKLNRITTCLLKQEEN